MSALRNGVMSIVAIALAAACVPSHAQDEHAHHAAHEATQEKIPSPSSDAPADHVAPPPPEHPMMPMSGDAMIDAMGMDDEATFAKIKIDRLERAFGGDSPAVSWDIDAWLGGDFDKLRIRSEGERVRGATEDADVEALWSHAVAPFWDTEIGVRHDVGSGPRRTWAAFGVQGLAPYWFELGATVYVGESGRTALRVEADYDLSLTQKLILQPRAEINGYGASDRSAGIRAGLSEVSVGLRLRYELRREFAPYVGLEKPQSLGPNANLAGRGYRSENDVVWMIGIRLWR